jgi:hypothetical protein
MQGAYDSGASDGSSKGTDMSSWTQLTSLVRTATGGGGQQRGRLDPAAMEVKEGEKFLTVQLKVPKVRPQARTA